MFAIKFKSLNNSQFDYDVQFNSDDKNNNNQIKINITFYLSFASQIGQLQIAKQLLYSNATHAPLDDSSLLHNF